MLQHINEVHYLPKKFKKMDKMVNELCGEFEAMDID